MGQSTVKTRPMPTKLAIPFGIFLILLGVVGYIVTGAASFTALIPAFFGIPVVALGWVARNPERRKHAMHAIALLALLGLGGTISSIPRLPGLFAGEAERPTAVAFQAIMAVVCAVYFALCLKSFIDARRARAQAQ